VGREPGVLLRLLGCWEAAHQSPGLDLDGVGGVSKRRSYRLYGLSPVLSSASKVAGSRLRHRHHHQTLSNLRSSFYQHTCLLLAVARTSVVPLLASSRQTHRYSLPMDYAIPRLPCPSAGSAWDAGSCHQNTCLGSCRSASQSAGHRL
jgi:hypothetical protein